MSKPQPLTNYNIFALQGDYETTDMDVVETMGLDPIVAHTPEINEAAISKMRRQNYEGYLDRGMDEKKANELADLHATAARAAVRAAMKDQKQDFQI